MKKIKMVVEKAKTGYSAYAEDYAVGATGKDYVKLKSNMVEALNLYFNKEKITEKDLSITLDISQFFEFYKVINAKALSVRIGMNQSLLAQYIKGIKKPSPSQTNRILKGVQQVGKELSSIQFIH